MNSFFAMFLTILKQCWAGSFFALIGSIFFLAIVFFAPPFESTTDSTSRAATFVFLTFMVQLMWLMTWSKQLRGIVQYKFSPLLPGYFGSAWACIGLMYCFTTLVPTIIGIAYDAVSLNNFLLVTVLAGIIIASKLLSDSISTVVISLTLLVLALEDGQVDAHGGSYFAWAKGFELMLMVPLIIFLGCTINYLIKQSHNRAKKSEQQKLHKQEYNLNHHKTSRFGHWFGGLLLQTRLFLMQQIFSKLHNRLSISLWSYQYWGFTLWRFIILVMVMFDLAFDADTVQRVFDTLSGDRDYPIALIMVTSFLALFDTSIFSRMVFAQKYVWLKEPVDGFENFKSIFTYRLIRNVALEFALTFTTLILIVMQTKLAEQWAGYLMFSFVALKLISIIFSLKMVTSKWEHSKIIFGGATALVVSVWAITSFTLSEIDLTWISLSTVVLVGMTYHSYRQFRTAYIQQ